MDEGECRNDQDQLKRLVQEEKWKRDGRVTL